MEQEEKPNALRGIAWLSFSIFAVIVGVLFLTGNLSW